MVDGGQERNDRETAAREGVAPADLPPLPRKKPKDLGRGQFERLYDGIAKRISKSLNILAK